MVVLGLGSNQGDRARHLREAVAALKNILSGIRCSAVYESPALLPEGAPSDWNTPFLNMAVCGETDLTPRALLDAVKTIEQKLGRVVRGHWGPREIDIDILAYGNHVVSEADLTIPHSGLLDRDFALIPLADVLPSWIYPAAGEHHGKTARELAAHFTHVLAKADIVIP